VVTEELDAITPIQTARSDAPMLIKMDSMAFRSKMDEAIVIKKHGNLISEESLVDDYRQARVSLHQFEFRGAKKSSDSS
jgi:hypothetical protein